MTVNCIVLSLLSNGNMTTICINYIIIFEYSKCQQQYCFFLFSRQAVTFCKIRTTIFPSINKSESVNFHSKPFIMFILQHFVKHITRKQQLC